MTLPIQVVDAFTAAAFRGNPAAVVLLDGGAPAPADGWMQSVAAEMKHSETAFLRARDDGSFDLRWFTPEVEVDLCGHATLASAHALWDWGTLAPTAPARFHTRSGLLGAVPRDGAIEMDFPATPAAPADEPPGLFDALGVPGADTGSGPSSGSGSGTGRAPGAVFRSDFYVLVELDDPAFVRAMAPDFDGLRKVDARAVIVTAREPAGSEFDVVSRVFGPNVGIPEDPVTGSAHCVLATHWAGRLGPSLRALQASSRGGVVRTRLDGDRVAIGGEAVTVLRGELTA